MSPSSSQPGGSRLRRLLALTAVAATAAGGAAVLAPAASAAESPWGFEQVTPENKGEGTVSIESSMARPSADGRTLFYAARSPFAGAPAESAPAVTRYVARRGPERWESKGTDAPNGPHRWILSTGTQATSTNLAYAIVTSTHALTPGATRDGGNIYIRDTSSGAYTLIATSPNRRLSQEPETHPSSNLMSYVADDGRSALFHASEPLTPAARAAGADFGLYKWTAAAGLELVSVLPRSEGGRAVNGATPGIGIGPREPFPSGPGALDHIYFQATEPGNSPAGLYVRSGEETRAVSVSRRSGASSTPVAATPYAVSDGGRYVLFGAADSEPLTDDAPIGFGNRSSLYRYDIVQDALEYIARAAPYSPVIQMTRDGQTIAFVDEGAYNPDAMTVGADVFVWRRGRTRLAHAIEGGARAAGGSLSGVPRLLSPNGRYLALMLDSRSAAERAGSEPQGPNARCFDAWGAPATCYQVYRFDADAPTDAESFVCVSCRRDGVATTVDEGAAGATTISGENFYDRRQAQTVTDDGTVFFSAWASLVPEDGNGLPDVYALRDGRHRLLSRATPETVSRFLDATPDGKTVFIGTNDRLVPGDTDALNDIYATGAGVGYATSDVVPPPPCEATCRGESADGRVSPIPPLASTSFVGGGDVEGGPAPVRAGRPIVSKVRAVRGSAGVLKVKVTGRGSLWLSGRGLAPVSRRTAKAGTFKLTARLTRAAGRALRKRGTVTRRARVSFVSEAGGTTWVNVALTFKMPAAGKKGSK